MKRRFVSHGALFCILSLSFVSSAVLAAGYPKEPVAIKLNGAKMNPVTFSHTDHVEKQKIACTKCHHMDVQNPKACTACHGREAKGKVPAAKDALHSQCQPCHKEMVAKRGVCAHEV